MERVEELEESILKQLFKKNINKILFFIKGCSNSAMINDTLRKSMFRNALKLTNSFIIENKLMSLMGI